MPAANKGDEMPHASNLNKPHQHSGVESYMVPQGISLGRSLTDAALAEIKMRKAKVYAELAALNGAPVHERERIVNGATIADQILAKQSELEGLEHAIKHYVPPPALITITVQVPENATPKEIFAEIDKVLKRR
jgi:hypothetical protein